MGNATLDAGHGSSLRLEETADARKIGGAHEVALLEPVLPLAGLLGQDVTVVGVPALELPTTCDLEALHGRAFGFLLRHLSPRLAAPTSVRSPSSCCGLQASR